MILMYLGSYVGYFAAEVFIRAAVKLYELYQDGTLSYIWVSYLRPALELYIRVCAALANAVMALIDGIYWVGSASVIEILPLLLAMTAVSWIAIFFYIRRDVLSFKFSPKGKAKASLLPSVMKDISIVYVDDFVDMSGLDEHED